MNKNNIFNSNTIIAFIIGIAVGFGGTLALRGPVDQGAEDVDKDSEISDTVSSPVFSGGNAILVRDQKAGVNIDVELVTLENAGWVVIHEDNNGVLGNALGAQLFDAGPSKGVVELLRGTEEGKTYYATIRQDDGDRAFDLTRDFLLSDIKGNPVQIKFKATRATSSEDKDE